MTRLHSNDIPLEGTNLIEASAGTGKTYTLTSIFLRLLAETTLHVSNILVVTFTEAATKELASRIRERLLAAHKFLDSGARPTVPDELIQNYLRKSEEQQKKIKKRFARAIVQFDDAAIYTIHGFCKRMLEDNAFESAIPFDSKLVKDLSSMRREIVYDYFAKRIYGAPRIFARYLASKHIWPSTVDGVVEKNMMGFDTKVCSVDEDVDEVVNTFTDAFNKAKSCWDDHRSEIEALLLKQNALKKNMFDPKKTPGWFEEIDEYLASLDLAYPLKSDSRRADAIGKLSTERLIAGTKKSHSTPIHPFFDRAADLVDASKRFDGLLVSFKRDLIEYSRVEFATRKSKERILSFDDLLSSFRGALSGPGREKLRTVIKKRFQAVLIDEFQDTDPLQYEIFDSLFGSGKGPMYYIGDPKQAIYGFRGANIYTYLKAAASAEGRRFVLDTNWRSDPGLIEAVNGLFGAATKPFQSEQINYSKVHPKEGAISRFEGNAFLSEAFQIRIIERPTDPTGSQSKPLSKTLSKTRLVKLVANDIAHLLGSGATIDKSPVRPSDIAVLTKTNKQAENIQNALSTLGVPSVLLGTDSVFESPEAKELYTILSAVLSPRRARLVKAALVTRIIGATADELLSLDASKDGIATVQSKFLGWRDLWFKKGIVPSMQRVLDATIAGKKDAVGVNLLAIAGGTRQLANTRHLVELLNKEALESNLSPWELLSWFASKIVSGDLESDDDKLRLETDAEAVRVITIHKSKGLEFKAVFCPYLWDGRLKSWTANLAIFHDGQNGYRRTLDLGTPELPGRKKMAATEETQENLRLLYVALTRAKCLNVVYWGALTDAHKSALGYLLHQTGAAKTPKQVSERISAMSDHALIEDIKQFVGRLPPGAASVTTAKELPALRYTAEASTSLDAGVRPFRGTIQRGTAVHSFSGVIRHGTHDDRIPHTESIDTESPKPGAERATIGLNGFEPGARAGNLVHAIFENLDFTVNDAASLKEAVSKELEVAQFEVDKWKDPISNMIRDVLFTPFCASRPDLRLAEIPNSNRINELEFLFPVSCVEKTEERLSTASLAEQMSDQRAGEVAMGYADQLRALDFSFDSGFVKGFMDLVFEWEGRYYLVDYKSNHLGPYPEDYGAIHLAKAMARHDYILQYHLYVVALHQYLLSRIPQYDYDAHFGEVAYLFVRGMTRDAGPTLGVFSDRPPKALVQGLSASFGRERIGEKGPP